MPKVNPEILIWARESAELSREDAAGKLGFRDSQKRSATERLAAYENGFETPSRSTLLKMSKQYRRPLLAFYLERPPKKGERGEDFRTLPEPLEGRENVYVDQLIQEVKACQGSLRQALIDEDEGQKLSFVGQYRIEDGINNVTNALHALLNMDINEYRRQNDQESAFKFLRQYVEAQRIFVLLKGNLGSHHTNINVKTFRGFAFADPIAPFIVINDLDSKAAWSFTLLHEIVHLLLGQTGISNTSTEQRIEQFCNDVTREYLISSEEFNSFQLSEGAFEERAQQISEYAITNKVSSSHISYRLYKRGDITQADWREYSSYFEEQWNKYRLKAKEKSRESDGGPNYYIVRKHKLGMLTDLVYRFMQSGTLTTTKAGQMLGVKAIKLHRLFNVGQSV